jgi:hypothetical protein
MNLFLPPLTDSKLSSGKTTFTIVFRIFLWIFVNIPQYGIAWRYRSRPVFWLPQGWFNPIVTWWLAFPFAPKGSVSVMTWTWACKYVLQIGNEVVKFIIRMFLLPFVVSFLAGIDELYLQCLCLFLRKSMLEESKMGQRRKRSRFLLLRLTRSR